MARLPPISVPPDAVQGVADQLVGQPVVERLVAHHQPPVERARRAGPSPSDVDVRPELAPVDGPLQDGGGGLASGREPAGPQGLGQRRVGLGLTDELGHDLAGPAPEGVDEQAELDD